MQTSETWSRAKEDALQIEHRGLCTDIQVISISGMVGGREYSPVMFHGHAVTYKRLESGDVCFKFWPGDEIRDCLKAVYVVDGVPLYVAGWQGDGTAKWADGGYVVLHPYAPDQTFAPHRAYFLTTSAISAS